MINQTIHFKNPNLDRIKEHPEKHDYEIIMDGTDAFRIENVDAGDEKVTITYRDMPDLKSILITVKGNHDHPVHMFSEFTHLVNDINQGDNPGKFTIDRSNCSLEFYRIYSNYEVMSTDLYQLDFEILVAYWECEQLLDLVAEGTSVHDAMEKLSDEEENESTN
jgi:hypothetical protein